MQERWLPMGIKQSMWQCLNYDVFKLKYWWMTLGNSSSLGSVEDFSATCFVIQQNSWIHWPSRDWAAKLLINHICPHENRPNYWVHALAGFLSSCAVTHMGVFCLIPFFPKSILPRSFREHSHTQMGAASALTQPQPAAAPQSQNAHPVCHSKAALPAEPWGWKTF